MTGKTDRQDRQTGRTDSQDGTAWIGFDSQKGQLEKDRQNKTAMTELSGQEPRQNWQGRAASTGVQG
jgi:hypothetical protein